jgi:carbonic anhydrase/acetyltransferase-like protein (isoleucine patch superfamily)
VTQPFRAPDEPTRPQHPPDACLVRLGDAFVASSALVWGDVVLGREASVWYGCVLRGDCARLTIGEVTNIQDLTMVHADTGVPHSIGSHVTVGHQAVLHGRVIGDECLVGVGALLLGGTEIGDGCIVGAGTVLTENTVVPPRSLVLGVPGRVVRRVTDEEHAERRLHAEHYLELARMHLRD